MALKVLPILFTILPILAASLCLEVSAARVGGWRPIENIHSPKVTEIAKFAVAEHNKQERAILHFVQVVRGESQVVSGTNYRLVISAKDGDGSPGNYQVVVWDKPWMNFRQLTSFVKL